MESEFGFKARTAHEVQYLSYPDDPEVEVQLRIATRIWCCARADVVCGSAKRCRSRINCAATRVTATATAATAAVASIYCSNGLPLSPIARQR